MTLSARVAARYQVAMSKQAAPRWLPTETNVWYQFPDRSGEVYFFCTTIQKNGGMGGIMVEHPWGRGSRRPQPKAKKYSTGQLFEGDAQHYKRIKDSDVPEEVKAAAK